MNNLLFCLITFLANPHQDSLCREQFYEAAVRDTSALAPFIKVEVVQEEGMGKAVIFQSGSVYRKRKFTGESFESYKAFMKDLLRRQRPITAEEFQRYGGNTFDPDRYVDRIAKKGKKKFINHFFGRQRTFNYQKYHNHQMAVMAKLFDFGILVAFVDNGQMGIVYNSDCE